MAQGTGSPYPGDPLRTGPDQDRDWSRDQGMGQGQGQAKVQVQVRVQVRVQEQEVCKVGCSCWRVRPPVCLCLSTWRLAVPSVQKWPLLLQQPMYSWVLSSCYHPFTHMERPPLPPSLYVRPIYSTESPPDPSLSQTDSFIKIPSRPSYLTPSGGLVLSLSSSSLKENFVECPSRHTNVSTTHANC